MRVLAKTRTAVNTDTSDVTDKVSRVGFYIILTMAIGFGIMSLASVVAGAISVGGIIPLLTMMVGVI